MGHAINLTAHSQVSDLFADSETAAARKIGLQHVDVTFVHQTRKVIESANLVVFSGGKAIGGPQASGILAGRADLIASVALQHQDMDVRPETWSWRPLLDSGLLAGVPHQGFGRSMKVGREEIVGLITALRRFAAGSDEEDLERWQRRLDPIEQALEGIPAIRVSRHVPQHKPVPSLRIDLEGDCAATAPTISSTGCWMASLRSPSTSRTPSMGGCRSTRRD